jgi:hypothetical protein
VDISKLLQVCATVSSLLHSATSVDLNALGNCLHSISQVIYSLEVAVSVPNGVDHLGGRSRYTQDTLKTVGEYAKSGGQTFGGVEVAIVSCIECSILPALWVLLNTF